MVFFPLIQQQRLSPGGHHRATHKKTHKKNLDNSNEEKQEKKRESTLDYTCYAEQKDSYRMAGIAKKRAPEQWESVEKSFFVCKEMKYRKAL